MKTSRTILTILAATAVPMLNAGVIAHFDMELHNGEITESVSGASYAVQGNFAPENVPGVQGQALRFDGYTSRVKAAVGNILTSGTDLTVSCQVALPCYPIIQLDTETAEQTPIISCLNEQDKSGFGFYLGFNGKYSFKTYVGGWPVTVEASTPLPVYQWNNLVAVVSSASRSVKLYNNGVEVGSGRANGAVNISASDFYMGQGAESRLYGPFQLMSFNGLIDEITIYNEAKDLSTIQSWVSTASPELDIPASRFADDHLRPRFHGMPAAGWTNECHGMYFADGKYHLFFQKNADGPYMARLHWGHITSTNLYDWQEEPIALAPGEWYDIKGCWSGCVFSDPVVTGGKPNIFYTAVDYSKAMIARAIPEDESLVTWNKYGTNPVISGKPAGLSDDFRDPYFFRSGDNGYLIVGSSKNGVGTTTLHRYNPTTGMWSNGAELFFTGTSAATCGSFWEMPTITPMADGKWLFTATPQGTAQGVRTLYWTGSISATGTFTPDAASAEPRVLELNSREGFGLLSPTVYQHEGKTIALGIVPDKLPATTNWRLGWAHCYSLPRQWELAADGTLIQKPFEGLTGMRTEVSFNRQNFQLNGAEALTPVSGRSAEILAVFKTSAADMGFKIFKTAGGEASVTYRGATAEVVVDLTGLPRYINDSGVYDGIYHLPLPSKPVDGTELKINVFIDHSILDIFINDRYASSIRLFPTDGGDAEIEAYSSAPVDIKELRAWTLDPQVENAGVEGVCIDSAERSSVDVFTLQGVCLKSGVNPQEAADGLAPGIYLVGKEKMIVR